MMESSVCDINPFFLLYFLYSKMYRIIRFDVHKRKLKRETKLEREERNNDVKAAHSEK